jgi:hypothetical protein
MAAPQSSSLRPSTTGPFAVREHLTHDEESPTRKSVSQSGARLARKNADRASAVFNTQQAIAEAASHASLNFEEIHAFHSRTSEVQVSDEEWLSTHPEVRLILHDFLSMVLADKPADLIAYAKQHFGRYFAAVTAASAAPMPAQH